MPTVVIPKVPRWERTKRGCGSASLMQPMPLASVEALQVVFEFRSKRRIFNRVDFSLESGFGVEENHACTLRSQMGVVVDAEEHIKNHIVVGCSSRNPPIVHLSSLGNG